MAKKKKITKKKAAKKKANKKTSKKTSKKKVSKKKTTKKKVAKKKITKKKASKKKSTTSKKAKKPSTPVVKKKRKVNYLNNKDMLAEVMASKDQGKMTDKLAKMLQMLAARYGRKGNFASYCVDHETEALTQDGWKTFNDITTNDIILSYDHSDGRLKWSAIHDLYINHDYVGMMHKLDTQGLDALVTSHHKFVSKERGVIPVEDIICNERIILMGQPVEDPQYEEYSDSFVQLVGWAITEGHYIKGSVSKRCITITQKEGIHSDTIRTALLESNVPYKEYTHRPDLNSFYCIGEDISAIYDIIAPNRVLSEQFILALSQRQRLLLIETMVNGDGWFRPNGGMSYVQKDKNHIDSFLMLCTISGLNTSTTEMRYKTPPSNKNPSGGVSDVYSINIYNKPKLWCKSERIDFHGGRPGPGGRHEQKSNTPTQSYEGVIWCPKTDYGTFVCRRGKYIYVTGNTYNEDMQAYAMMMLVNTWNSFNPEKSNNPFAFFTQCIKNSFVQYLNKEKRQRDIRDASLVNNGLTPSFSYQMEHEAKMKQHREVDSHDQHIDDDDLPPPSSSVESDSDS